MNQATALLVTLLTYVGAIACSADMRLPERSAILETLADPVQVVDWDAESLTLADGRTVVLPAIAKEPKLSDVLRATTTRGVEIDREGRAYVLVPVWHGCGNDPVGKHEARIDLSYLLRFLDDVDLSWESTYTEWGWRSYAFHRFERWRDEVVRCSSWAALDETGTPDLPED